MLLGVLKGLTFLEREFAFMKINIGGGFHAFEMLLHIKKGGSYLLKHYYIIFILLGVHIFQSGGYKYNNILYVMPLSDLFDK